MPVNFHADIRYRALDKPALRVGDVVQIKKANEGKIVNWDGYSLKS